MVKPQSIVSEGTTRGANNRYGENGSCGESIKCVENIRKQRNENFTSHS